MKNSRAFLRQVSKNGLYIILFLCVLAVGISGYVMYRADVPELPVVEETTEIEEPVINEYEPVSVPEKEPASEPEKKEASAPAEIPVAAKAPVYVTAVKGKVERAFTGDELVKCKTFNDWRVHQGIEIAAAEGSEVYAICDGVVSDVYEDDMLGHTVVIEHSGGIVSRYSNLIKGIVVKKGDKVSGGAVIGGVGDSAAGESMECEHLHLEVTKNGVQIDPMSLIK